MTLPPQIELRARCAQASDLSGLIFRMQITAGYKNPYGIFFPKTDSAGHARLTAEDINGQFTDHWEEALMDYNGLIEDANELVTIRLWDPTPLREGYGELLAWPLFTHQRTRWQSRRDYLDYMIYAMMQDNYFGNLMLSKLDLLSSRLGLESRCPFTEPAYAHWVYNVPAALKSHDGWVKYFFKRSIEGASRHWNMSPVCSTCSVG